MANSSIDTDDEVAFLDKANSISTAGMNNGNENHSYYAKKSKRDNVVGPWKACKLLECIESNDDNERTNIVQFMYGGYKKDVAAYEMAARKMPSARELDVGTRVIARRRYDQMPYKFDENGEQMPLVASVDKEDKEYYPGILAGFHQSPAELSYYLVFFDDGIVQYVQRKHIRRVLGNDSYKHAHWNAKAYFEFFVTTKQWEVRTKVGDKLQIELNGDPMAKAEVLEINSSLAKIHFAGDNRYEWIHLGSPRFSTIYRNLVKQKLLDKILDIKKYNTCLSASHGDVMVVDLIELDDEPAQEAPTNDNDSHAQPTQSDQIVKPNQPTQHICGPSCLPDENLIDIEKYGAFQRPLLLKWERIGWQRGERKRFYRAPCGVALHSYDAIDNYLVKTDSKLRIDCFVLDAKILVEMPKIHTDADRINDISRGVEKIPIPVAGQRISLEFNYITGYNFEHTTLEPEVNLGQCCECEDNCRDKSKCSCWRQTVGNAGERNAGYKHMKLQKSVDGVIVECGAYCNCNPAKCVNRVVKNGIQQQLELFNTTDKGWGLRAKFDLPKGTFISNYAGDVLNELSADLRDTKYQFRLGSFKDNADQSQDSESESDDDDEPEAKRPRHDLDEVSQMLVNYFPAMINENAKHLPESDVFESNGEISIVVDAIKNGNVSRFINHSCDPNMFTQLVYEDDNRFPSIAFFTNKQIKAGQELTFDYRYEEIEGKETMCQCKSSKCRKRLM